jgi:crotonobetainyl-CoA:carnitine CoA-transferase CaiB-like acyl-CoA transferase
MEVRVGQGEYHEEHPVGGALGGIVVADFSRVLAGPLASMFLGDLGATVIKVERPDVGDESRGWGPPYVGPMSTYYTSVNRNKQSLTLDLTDPGDASSARELAERADVLVENFLPGKLAAFGLDHDALRVRNPRLVYCSISGFGPQEGSELLGYDFVVQAVGGLMSITGQPGGDPMKVGVALVDVLTGLHATIGILAALHERDRSGLGQLVEVNLLSSLISSLVNQGAGYINGADVPTAMGNRHPSIVPYEMIDTQDSPLAIAVGNDRQFRALAETVGLPRICDDDRFSDNAGRVINRDALIDLLQSALKLDSASTWTTRLQAVGIPCGPVNNIAQAIEFATGLGLNPVATFSSPENRQTIATLASPLTLSRTPVTYRLPPPGLGANSTDVRAWLEEGASPPTPSPATEEATA